MSARPIPTDRGTARLRGQPPNRWLAAAVIGVAILAAGIGLTVGAFLLNGRASAGGMDAALGYVPANAATYYELRLDLPGDQRAKLQALLGHFPKAAGDTLSGDTLDRWLDAAFKQGGGKHSYTADVKSWFDGRLAAAQTAFDAGALSGAATMPRGLLLVGVKDRSVAESRIAALAAEATGASMSSESYQGVSIHVVSWPSPGAGPAGTPAGTAPHSVAYAVTADELIVSNDATGIRGALDVHAGRVAGLAANAELRAAVARLPTDRVATTVVNSAAVYTQLRASLGTQQTAMTALLDALAQLQSNRVAVAAARFENDRLVITGATGAPTGDLAAENRDRGLASHAPPDALLYAETGNVGRGWAALISGVKAALKDRPEGAQLKQAETALKADLESYVRWIGDAAVVAGWDGSQPYLGAIITPTDAREASLRLLQLQALAQLAAAGGGGPKVTVDQQQHGTARITTVRISVPGATIPEWARAVQYSVTDGRVVIGIGERFVGRVLDQQPAASLASVSRFRQAVEGMGGPSSVSLSWVDLAGIRTAIEKQLPPAVRAPYEAQVQPWLRPLDLAVGVTRLEDGDIVTRGAITVK